MPMRHLRSTRWWKMITADCDEKFPQWMSWDWIFPGVGWRGQLGPYSLSHGSQGWYASKKTSLLTPANTPHGSYLQRPPNSPHLRLGRNEFGVLTKSDSSKNSMRSVSNWNDLNYMRSLEGGCDTPPNGRCTRDRKRQLTRVSWPWPN